MIETAAAASRLDTMGAIARDILATIEAINNPIPAHRFNDDDFYVYDEATLELLQEVGCKAGWRPVAKPGQAVARGMRAKWLGLWKVQA